jgi:hypothetical protein
MGESLIFQCIFNIISGSSRGSYRPSIVTKCNAYARTRSLMLKFYFCHSSSLLLISKLNAGINLARIIQIFRFTKTKREEKRKRGPILKMLTGGPITQA